MKKGDTVFVIHRANIVKKGELAEKTTAQGFYTRWGDGHVVNFRRSSACTLAHAYNDEDIFSTQEAAKKEAFIRVLRYPRIRGAA